MAIAQRQFQTYGVARRAAVRHTAVPLRAPDVPRPATRPAARRAPRAGVRVPSALLVRPIICAAVVTVALVAYLSGYAAMTSAGYQRSSLRIEQRTLLERQQLLHTAIDVHGSPAQIAQWAQQHGFVHVERPAVPLKSLDAAIGQYQTIQIAARER